MTAHDAPRFLYVYFVQAGERGPIKVGSATHLRRRLSGLQTGHYEQLHLIASLRDPEGTFEQAVHEYLADAHIRGEWFRSDHPAVKELIAALLSDEIPPWLTPRPASTDFESAPVQCSCGWPVESELADRGVLQCFSCYSEARSEKP